jgi:hypothetical protein
MCDPSSASHINEGGMHPSEAGYRIIEEEIAKLYTIPAK